MQQQLWTLSRQRKSTCQKVIPHNGRGIKVRLCFVVADWAPEQFSPTSCDPLPSAQGEPLPFRATMSTILTGAMRIDLHRDCSLGIDLLFGEPIDLSPHLVRLFAIEPSGFAPSP